ncbi:MAG: hypothetical protein ACRD1B_04080 [Thermoanaerobaculia bacterium]
MTRRLVRPLLFASLLLAAGFAFAAGTEERTLLTTDGTLYRARAGTVADLGITNLGLDPDLYVVEWGSLAQDGTRQQGVLQGSPGANPKTSLDLTFDEPTGSFVVLWREDAPIFNQIHIAVLRSGVWSFTGLLPNLGFPQALNPQMLLSHQTVSTTDDKGNVTRKNRSTLSVIWWEEARYAQARYAPVFLDEPINSDSVKIYDLPFLLGGGGPTSYEGAEPGSYLYPALQLEGPGGAVLASFADLNAQKHFVIRIDFPTNLGNPNDPKNPIWQRRRIPVVGIAADGPIGFQGPSETRPERAPVGTVIGSSYNPTLYWRDGDVVRYIRFDGKAWSDPLSISLNKSLSFDRALRLLEAMAARN